MSIAPPPRRPNYHRQSLRTPPPSTPSDYYQEEYSHEAYGRGTRGGYERDHHQGWGTRQHHTSSQFSDASSICSASDCEECAYVESRRAYAGHGRSKPTKPVPCVIVPPRNGVSPGQVLPRGGNMRRGPYAEESPRVYRLHDSTDLSYGPPPTREASLADNASIMSGPHNQLVLFQHTSRSTDSGGRVHSDGMSMLHSNVSSPRWSVSGQQYLSGSETYSDVQSQSPMTSLDELYENPDPRFVHHAPPPPRVNTRRPVVITRSNEGYRLDPGNYEGYNNTSSDDRNYSDSEGSFSSDDREYRPRGRGGERRYW